MKFLINIGDDEKVKLFDSMLAELTARKNARAEFAAAQIKKQTEDFDAEEKSIYALIELRLVELNVLKDSIPTGKRLTVTEDDQVFIVDEHEACGCIQCVLKKIGAVKVT